MSEIITVLKRGGEYDDSHVERLRKQCRGYPFEVLDDDRMLHGFPGWWAKIELFRFKGPYLYMDLDTMITGPLDTLLAAAEKHDFIALRDFYRPNQMGSGLMAWRGDMSHIYDRFLEDPQGHMARCQTPKRWGDQGFISECDLGDIRYWQDVLPGEVVSWKRDGVTGDANVVCFHGKPRPWDVGL
jgi:hypothetical protein